jgi:hypothetical protein
MKEPDADSLKLESKEGIAKLLEDFHKQISEIDRLATAVLKAHFLVEEQIDSVLEVVAKNPEHLGLERNPRFTQKVNWIRSFGPLGDNDYWRLILAINNLRNKVAHKFDGPERKQAITNLRNEYRRILEPDPNDAELRDYNLILVVSMFSIAFLVKLRSLTKELQHI